MRRARGLLLGLCAVLGLAACARPKIQITPDFVLTTDGGAPLTCADFADLACVNYIKFQIEDGEDLTPPIECITVDKRLDTLCDLTELAHGTEIFRFDMDARVRVKMFGLRVFPATSCEIVPDCPVKTLFDGVSDWATIDQSGALPLHINFAMGCGAKEVYRPRGDRDCFSVCDYTEPVCNMHDGCVCLVPE